MKARPWLALALAVAINACSLGDFDLQFEDACASDEACPTGTVCRDGFLGASCESGVCVEATDCKPPDQCRLRSSQAGVTRKTCEERSCQCDANCPAGFVCSDAGWFSDSKCTSFDPNALCASNQDCGPKEECRLHGQCQSNAKLCQPFLCLCDDECPGGQVCPQVWGGTECKDAHVCESAADCSGDDQCSPRDTSQDLEPCAPEHVRSVCQAP